MYTSAKQIPDYRWPRITFTYSIHLPLHTGGYWILPRIVEGRRKGGGGVVAILRTGKRLRERRTCRKRKERGRWIAVARLPSGKATDDDKNGEIFIATINAVSCLPSCLRNVLYATFHLFIYFSLQSDVLGLDVHFLEISINGGQSCGLIRNGERLGERSTAVKIILKFPLSKANI